MTPQRFARIRAVLAARQPDLTVVMENVHKPHNLAAIARTCDAVGVGTVHAVAPGGSAPALGRHASSGSARWVETHTHADLAGALLAVRRQDMQVITVDVVPDARDFRDVDYTQPVALLVGAELDGLSAAARAAADVSVRIPMAGMVESLNVSVATALVLFEAQRQRHAAGMYQQSRLDDAARARMLFEWAHPEVAAWCRRQGRAYPALSEDGDIVEPLTENARGAAGRPSGRPSQPERS